MVDFCRCVPTNSAGWPISDKHTLADHEPQWWCSRCGSSVKVVTYNGSDDTPRHVVTVHSSESWSSHVCGPVVYLALACKDCSDCDQYRSLEDWESGQEDTRVAI